MAISERELKNKNGELFHIFQDVLEEKFGPIRTEIDNLKLGGEDREKIEKIQKDLSALSEEYKAARIAAATPANNLESKDIKAARIAMESKSAFNKALKAGIGSLNQDEKKYVNFDAEKGIETKALYTGDATTGGFLAVPEYVNQLIEFITLYSDMPSIVSMRYTSKPWVMTPRKTQTASAVRVAEQATRTETQNPKFGLVQNFPYESYAFTLVSRTDLDDSELDLGAFLMKEFAMQFAVLVGKEYLSGRGSNAGESFGLLNDPIINNGGNGTITTTSSGALDYASMVKVKTALKPAYWPKSTWIFTNETLGQIQTLTDNQGRPLWVPFGGVLPETLFGRPYRIMPDMPQMAVNGGSAGALAVAVGSFEDAYEGVVRKQVSMQTLYERYADQNAIGYFGYYRFGGVVKLSEAVKTLRIHV